MEFKEFREKIKTGDSHYFKWESVDMWDSKKCILSDIVFVNGDMLKSIYSKDHVPTRKSSFHKVEQVDVFDNVIRFMDNSIPETIHFNIEFK